MTETTELPWCKHGINKSGYCADCKVASLITNIESLESAKEITLNSHRFLEGVIAQHEATIESQKEEIEKLLDEQKENENIIKRKLKIKQDAIDKSMTKIESLKAITELAVKGLKEQFQIASICGTVTNTINLDKTLSEIERLSHA